VLWIKNVIANLIFLILYFSVMTGLKIYIVSRFEKSVEKEKEATKLNTFLIRSIFLVNLIFGVAGSIFIIVLNSNKFTFYRHFYLFIIYFIEIFIISIFFATSIQAKILNQKLKNAFFLRQIVSGFLGLVLMFGIIFLPVFQISKTGDIKYLYFLSVAIFVGNYLFYLVIFNLQYPKRKLKENEGKIIKDTLKKFEIESIEVEVLDTLGQKFANLFAAGLFKQKLLVTSYALENLKEEEIKAAVVHEIGHIKAKHGQKILFGWFVAILYYLSFVFGLESIVKFFVPNFEFYRSIQIIIFLTGTVQFLFLPSFISRTAEIEADLFVLKSGIKREEYESTLKTLYAINYIKGDISNALEKVQSHPSLKNRIKILAEAENKLKREDEHKLNKICNNLTAACALFATVYLIFGVILS